MWIYLLRHGIAEDPRPGGTDEERRLTEEGIARLRKAARSWQKLVEGPDLIVTSPYPRARQTAEILADATDHGFELREHDGLVPHGRTEDAVTLLEGELLSGTGSVAIVGHEPHLGYLLGSLLTGHGHLSVPLKKGMLVALKTESPTNVICSMRYSMTQRVAGKLGG